MTAFDAIVVGAGPAGSAAAGMLAARGRRVLVLEKERFPRRKVCGEFLSGSAVERLERLGVRQDVEARAERIREGEIYPPDGRPVAFRLPAPGLGISRLVLDDLLARRAGDLGAEVRFGARVRELTPAAPGFRIRFSEGTRDEEIEARGVVGAWGRWDALDRALSRGFTARRGRFFAWSRSYAPSSELAGRVRVYLFRGGYCGLSRVEGGAVNLAGVVAESLRARLPPGWDAVLEHARRSNAALDRDLAALAPDSDFLGAGPVYFTGKPPAEGGILMVGDAAGVLDPFCGEGQACALASGILAAQTLERGLSGEIPLDSAAAVYASAWREQFRGRFAWSAAFRRLMLHPRLAAAAAPWAGGRLTRLALERLRT
ncbi:MAG: NAD(P)/FAD-dependent oxidoreductase [Thermoanaerobaculia bacterium]